MSKEFGLDWQDYDVQRMQSFLQIMIFEEEREKKHQKKQKSDEPKFRKRG